MVRAEQNEVPSTRIAITLPVNVARQQHRTGYNRSCDDEQITRYICVPSRWVRSFWDKCGVLQLVDGCTWERLSEMPLEMLHLEAETSWSSISLHDTRNESWPHRANGSRVLTGVEYAGAWNYLDGVEVDEKR